MINKRSNIAIYYVLKFHNFFVLECLFTRIFHESFSVFISLLYFMQTLLQKHLAVSEAPCSDGWNSYNILIQRKRIEKKSKPYDSHVWFQSYQQWIFILFVYDILLISLALVIVTHFHTPSLFCLTAPLYVRSICWSCKIYWLHFCGGVLSLPGACSGSDIKLHQMIRFSPVA